MIIFYMCVYFLAFLLPCSNNNIQDHIKELKLSNEELKKNNTLLKCLFDKEIGRREQNENVIIEQILDLEDVVGKHVHTMNDQV